jgi:hypothetical protein
MNQTADHERRSAIHARAAICRPSTTILRSVIDVNTATAVCEQGAVCHALVPTSEPSVVTGRRVDDTALGVVPCHRRPNSRRRILDTMNSSEAGYLVCSRAVAADAG